MKVFSLRLDHSGRSVPPNGKRTITSWGNAQTQRFIIHSFIQMKNKVTIAFKAKERHHNIPHLLRKLWSNVTIGCLLDFYLTQVPKNDTTSSKDVHEVHFLVQFTLQRSASRRFFFFPRKLYMACLYMNLACLVALILTVISIIHLRISSV